jgi:hypothetical protein
VIAAQNSFSLLLSKIFSQKKVSLTNPVVALSAEQPANNKTTVAVSVVVAATAASKNAKCTTQLALLVVLKPKFLSVQAMIVPFIAETASAKTAVVIKKSKLLRCTAREFLL